MCERHVYCAYEVRAGTTFEETKSLRLSCQTLHSFYDPRESKQTDLYLWQSNERLWDIIALANTNFFCSCQLTEWFQLYLPRKISIAPCVSDVRSDTRLVRTESNQWIRYWEISVMVTQFHIQWIGFYWIHWSAGVFPLHIFDERRTIGCDFGH